MIWLLATIMAAVFNFKGGENTSKNSEDIDREMKESKSLLVPQAPPPPRPWIVVLLTSLCTGIVFGFVFEKSRVFEPVNIRGQFLLQNWSMLKMFLAAVTAGALEFVLASLLFKTSFQHARDAFISPLCNHGFGSAAIGGGILGVGMAVAGACPGMVLPQVGSGVPNSGFTILGLCLGALTFGLLHPAVGHYTDKGPKTECHFVDRRLKRHFTAVCACLAIGCGAVVVALEVTMPWYTELGVPNSAQCNVFNCRAWPSWACGALLGSLQLPALLAHRDTLGSSSGFVTFVSQWLVLVKQEHRQKYFPYLERARLGRANWWQVFHLSAAVLGAYLSFIASGSLRDPGTKGVSLADAIIGGFMMLFAARCAGGCTSGHGISGMALLNELSFVAVPAMFACGIATAFAYQAADPSFALNNGP